MELNCRSMTKPLRDVLLRHPSVAWRSQDAVNASWLRYRYSACPDFLQACTDFDVFVRCLEETGSTVHLMDDGINAGIDSIYVHDPALTIGDGVVLARMGKGDRRGERVAFESYCHSHDIRILGHVEAPGMLEGGDVIWLDETTLAVGLGYRTNAEGVRQLGAICDTFVPGVVKTIVSVPLPHFRGPSDVLHLMSLISPVADTTAVVYKQLLPVPFLRELEEREFELIDVPPAEFDLLGCNVLAVNPQKAVMAASAPMTRAKLERSGIEVATYPATEISLKGQGGPTCLTRPLRRL